MGLPLFGKKNKSKAEVKETGKARLQMTASEQSLRRLETMKERVDASSFADVIRDAMKAYEAMVDEADADASFFRLLPDGTLAPCNVFYDEENTPPQTSDAEPVGANTGVKEDGEEKKSGRLQVVLSTASEARLKRLMEKIGTDVMAEVVRESLKIYEYMIDQAEQGILLGARRGDGPLRVYALLVPLPEPKTA